MFGHAYSYGHLLFAAMSLTIAFAFAVSALRIVGLRSDLWNALIYLSTTSAGVLEMTNSLAPSLVGARIYFVIYAGVFAFVSLGAYEQYARLVLTPVARRRYRLAVIVYAAWGATLAVTLLAGLFDGGRVQTSSLWGAHGAVIATSGAGALILGAYCICNVPLNMWVLFAPGPRAFERRLVAGSMMLSPAIVVWELLISVGVNPYVPVGGYFASLLGLNGALVLIERFRNLSESQGTVGGYVIERRLGGGGMADVFLGYRETSDLRGIVQRAAIKRLRLELAGDLAFVEMFLEEARVAARLSHPNVVRLYDVVRQDRDFFLAMELVEGASLAQIFHLAQYRGERLSSVAAVEVGLQLCDALSYVHGLRDEEERPLDLVHRDVSPQNVLVDRAGQLKLTDFGIARSADRTSRTATGVVKGKFSYMAPEQLRGDAYDHRVDLYGLGVILFELAVGRRLHGRVAEDAVPLALLQRESLRLDGIELLPAPLADAIRRALAFAPADRVASAAELRALLLPLRDEQAGGAALAAAVKDVQTFRDRRHSLTTRATVRAIDRMGNRR